MTIRNNESLLEQLVASLDLPDSAYDKAKNRYEDLGNWLGRDESSCTDNSPHIFPQGSFRLGTAIRPLSGTDEYDLDLACNLQTGISSTSHSQKQLKDKIGYELEQYRKARSIKAPLDAKHRCWRLDYADGLNFHMDIVPCIPESETQRNSLAIAMESYGLDKSLAADVSEKAVAITDDRSESYEYIHSDWMISNPEGYAQWFESNMQTKQFNVAMEAAQVDDIPNYKRKTPLQRCIQLLKRHRDQMFTDKPDSKPISVIITTIAAESYSGSDSIEIALKEVLAGLQSFVDSPSDIVPNPVNPQENFADRWAMPQYEDLQLKNNFSLWVAEATRDFNVLLASSETELISESISDGFSVNISTEEIGKTLGLSAAAVTTGYSHAKPIEKPISQPWLQGE